MQRERRLRRRADFDLVLRRGRSFAHPLLILRFQPNQGTVSRWGFSVGKRVGGAVVRNRVRRRLREIARAAPVRPGLDLVLIARPDAAKADFQTLRAAVTELLRRAKILEPAPDGSAGSQLDRSPAS